MQYKPLKKPAFTVIIIICIVMFTILQGYWALWPYHTAVSSSCMECSFSGDLFYASALALFIIGLLQLIYWWLKPGLIYQTVFCVMTLMLCWYATDTIIFDEREASWSTYSNIWTIGILISILQITIFGVVFGVIYYVLYPEKK